MKLTNVKKNDDFTIELSILVPADEFDRFREKAYRKQRNSIAVQGFRKGKAPRKLIEKVYGEEVFYETAMEDCYPVAYREAIDEAELVPIKRPELRDLDINEGAFSFVAVIEVKPDITVKKYKGLTVEKAEPVVTDEDVNEAVESYRKRNSRLVTVDRESKNGDTVVIDFNGMIDGVPFDGGQADNFSLKLGSGTFIPGFEEQLVGKRAGESCDVNVTFPEEYQAEELAGKAAVFQCKLHEVKEEELPELDDEFAKDISEFDTLEEYKADLRTKLIEAKEREVESNYKNNLAEALIEQFEGTVPEAMIESNLDDIMRDYDYQYRMQGANLETFLMMNQMDVTQFRQIFRDMAEKQAKLRLCYEKIAEVENLNVTDEEIETQLQKLITDSGMKREEVLDAIRPIGIKYDLLCDAAMKLVEDSVEIVPPSEKPEESKPKKTVKKVTAKKTADKDNAEDVKPVKKSADKKTDEKSAKKAEAKADKTEDAAEEPKKKTAKAGSSDKTTEKKPAKKAAPKKTDEKTDDK